MQPQKHNENAKSSKAQPKVFHQKFKWNANATRHEYKKQKISSNQTASCKHIKHFFATLVQ
jgi:hypothetical protein